MAKQRVNARPWASLKCAACDGNTPPMSQAAIRREIQRLSGWQLVHGTLRKTYRFKDYHQTLAFVNATAWISHRENHHPDLTVQYNRCTVAYYTHAIDAISENDFICAAKIEALFNL